MTNRGSPPSSPFRYGNFSVLAGSIFLHRDTRSSGPLQRRTPAFAPGTDKFPNRRELSAIRFRAGENEKSTLELELHSPDGYRVPRITVAPSRGASSFPEIKI